MKLTFTLPDERVFSLDAPLDTRMSGVRLMVAIEAGASEKHILLIKDGQALSIDEHSTVHDCKLSENDLIIVVINRPQFPAPRLPENNIGSLVADPSIHDSQSSASVPNHPDLAEIARQHLLSAPPAQQMRLRERNQELYDALNDQDAFKRLFDAQRNMAQQSTIELNNLVYSDQLNPDVQRRIAELIRQKNIDREMESAMEYYPETFGQVIMLYVACEVNNFPIKAFVDSGAQSTIMSMGCARRCNLEHLIDKRWSGMAYGVGTQKIIGRIHQAQLKIGGTAIPSSFVVLEDQPMDLMIGLDMLKRHKCCINLADNVLTVGDHTRARFLPEAELPDFAKQPFGGASSPSATDSSTLIGQPQEALTDEQISKVNLLTSQSVPRDRAIALLTAANWDADMALVQYMSSQP